MINYVTVYNDLGEYITMDLRRPEQSGFLIQYIDGLGPTKATIEMTEMAMIDGAIYNSSRSSSRNIVFGIIFLGNDIGALRQDSYKYFPLRRRIRIVIETDVRISQTYGYVESNDPAIFTNMAGTKVSVRCPSSYLFSDSSQITYFNAVQELFEFPFSNESLSESLIEFSSLQLDPIKSIEYEGDVEIGVVLTVHALGVIENLEIYNTQTNESISINTDRLESLTGTGLHEADDIIISTVKGNKYAKLIRDGQETNILNCLDMYPDWFQLQKGPNIFTYTAESGEPYVQLKIENQVIYEGI